MFFPSPIRVPLAHEVKEVVKDLPDLLVFEELMVWLDPLDHLYDIEAFKVHPC